jgi:hypothetical protein
VFSRFLLSSHPSSAPQKSQEPTTYGTCSILHPRSPVSSNRRTVPYVCYEVYSLDFPCTAHFRDPKNRPSERRTSILSRATQNSEYTPSQNESSLLYSTPENCTHCQRQNYCNDSIRTSLSIARSRPLSNAPLTTTSNTLSQRSAATPTTNATRLRTHTTLANVASRPKWPLSLPSSTCGPSLQMEH